jgi:hypothetical protein
MTTVDMKFKKKNLFDSISYKFTFTINNNNYDDKQKPIRKTNCISYGALNETTPTLEP